MWPFRSQHPIKVHLRYADIPSQTPREVECACYPQKSRPIPALSLIVIRDRYASALHALLDGLPLSAEDIDRYLMPVIERFIRLVHLLPASESQHHAGVGGLLLHSLETAAIAQRRSETLLLNRSNDSQKNYLNQPRQTCLCMLILLFHDIGKLDDIVVSDKKGRVWIADRGYLLDWLESNHITEYFVDWKPDREHKKHERRALRFAYRFLMTSDLINYLTEVSNSALLNAMEDALIFGQGPFGDLLRTADGQSVAMDLARRKRLNNDNTYLSSPLITPIVNAMEHNIRCGLWASTGPDAVIFNTANGLFIRADSRIGNDIRTSAVAAGFPSVPTDIERIVNLLADAGFAETDEAHTQFFFDLKTPSGNIRCFKFLAPEQLLKVALPLSTLSPVAIQSSIESTSNIHRLMPTATDYQAILNGTAESPPSNTVFPQSLDVRDTLSDTDMNTILKQPLSKEACKAFAQRLFASVHQQLLNGGGPLVGSIQKKDDTQSCSSLMAEQIANNHRINLATLDALFDVLNTNTCFSFHSKSHQFELRF